MSRAGLVSLIFFALIGLAISAPLSERLSSLVERYDEYGNDIHARSLVSLLDEREFHIYIKRDYDFSIIHERDFDLAEHEYTKRDDSDLHMLYRRKSIFTKIRDGFRKVGHVLKAGFKKVGQGLKTAVKAIKKVGAKVAKFALKVGAAVASVAAKVVKFIPGVGTGISMALKGAAIGANAASNKIHANLGKLDKVTKGLDYVINPMSAAAKAAGKAKGGKAGSVVASLFT